jgi:outer membrane protein
MQLFRMLPLTLALGAALAAPAQAQSLIELVESARTYDSSWQSAQAQLEAARRRADQARAGLLPSAGLSAGVSRSNTEITVPPVDRNNRCTARPTALPTNKASAAWTWPRPSSTPRNRTCSCA